MCVCVCVCTLSGKQYVFWFLRNTALNQLPKVTSMLSHFYVLLVGVVQKRVPCGKFAKGNFKREAACTRNFSFVIKTDLGSDFISTT